MYVSSNEICDGTSHKFYLLISHITSVAEKTLPFEVSCSEQPSKKS